MDFRDANKSGIGFDLDFFSNMRLGFFEMSKIVTFSIAERGANYFASLFVNDDLRLLCVKLFLS
jgi:hypothetical protein